MAGLINNMIGSGATIVNNDSGITFDTTKWATIQSISPDREREDYRERFADDASSVVRVFDVLWTKRKEWLDEVLGYSQKVAPNTLARVLPVQHPEYPWLYAVEAELLQGVGTYARNAAGTMIAFYNPKLDSIPDGYARYAVTYRALDYDVLTDAQAAASPQLELSRYVSFHEVYSAEQLQYPGGAFIWVTAPQDRIMTGPKRLTVLKEVTLMWRQVPDLPEAAIQAAVGKVNSSTFTVTLNGKLGTPLTRTYDAETLLFLGPAVKRIRGARGHISWDIAYKFLFNPNNHNKIFRRDPLGYEYVTDTGTLAGRRIYDSASFASLFVLPV